MPLPLKVVAVAGLAILTLLSSPALAAGPLCNQQQYTVWSCSSGPPCHPNLPCAVQQSFWCGSGAPSSELACTYENCGPCPPGYGGDGSSSCQKMGGSEACGNGLDDNYDGCIDEGCVIGEPPGGLLRTGMWLATEGHLRSRERQGRDLLQRPGRQLQRPR